MELVWSTSRGGNFVRSILVFALTVILTALLWATFGSQTASAAPDPALPATWKGESIVFDGRQYFPAAEAESGESHGLPEGTIYYLAVETVSERPLERKAHVIYFAPGADPPTATTATYVNYDYSSNETFSNPEERTTINLDKKGEEGSYSACEVAGGIGWIICPVAVFLADAMDGIFGFVAQFVEVPAVPVNDTNTPLYQAWNIMRSIANVAFIIAFLIIIYSQLTSYGVSNYGIKKLLPRLIIAAILVNVSFYVTAIAVDISNIAGFSFQEILVNIRQDTFTITDGSTNNEATNSFSWANVTAYILSGGAAVAGVGAGLAATGGSITAAVYLLIPLLLGLVLTVIFVFLVLAARQAIIIILIVIAPLAFVANLLPNTEKWFEKWKDLFMSMLIFFPAFSLVFGGSQLAGGIIIQNANNVLMMIFGMAVQIAPLIITPLIIKLSGGLLGRIAGIMNDPRRGALDRAKNWSGARANMHKQKSLSRTPGDFKRSRNPVRNLAQRMSDSERNVKKAASVYENQAETNYMGRNRQYAKLNDLEHEAHMDREIVDSRHKLRAQEHLNHVGSAQHLKHAQAEAGKLAVERATQATAATMAGYKAGDIPVGANPELTATIKDLDFNRQELAVEKARLAAADNMQVQRYATAIELSEDLQVRAGGIDPKGAQRALAAALAAQNRAHSEAVTNAASILTHYNYGDDTVAEIALGTKPAHVNINITDDIREAAIEQIAGGANTDQIMNLMANLDINPSEENQDFRQAFADKLIRNSSKPKFAGAGIIANIKQGVIPTVNGQPAVGKARLDDYIAQTINANKLSSAELLVTHDRSYLEAVLATLRNNESETAISAEARQILKKSIELAKTDTEYSGRIGERKAVLDNIEALLDN